MPYFSTSLKPGVVFLVPAITPFHPDSCAVSRNLRELVSATAVVITAYRAYTDAIPEHLASRLRPTRSASNSCRAFPRTIATFVLVLGGTTDPSSINHSTLVSVSRDCPVESPAYLHPAYLNTSSKNGTPARIPLQSAPSFAPASLATHSAFAQKPRLLLLFADDESSPVETGCVFLEPFRDVLGPRRGQQVPKVLSRL